jgi:hypothetical protein
MSQQQGIVKGDDLQRVGSLGFIIGGVLLIIFNGLDILSVDTDRRISVLFVAIGVWGLTLGFVAIYRSITAAGAGWARMGFYLVIVGTAIYSVEASMFAATVRLVAEGHADMVAAIEVVGHQAQAMWVLATWLGIFIVGIGMVRSTVYPKWQGWSGLILGVLTYALAGVPLHFLGEESIGGLLFGVLAGLSTIWALIIGIWIARKAW